MKLSVPQIIFSVLIILAACYVTGWMIHEAPSLYRQPIPDPAGEVTYVDVTPEDEMLFDISRYSSYALPPLGILALIISTVQAAKAEARSRLLVIINIVAGVLIAASAFFIITWGFPTQFHAALGGGNEITIFTNPGRSLFGVEGASGALIPLGVAVFGCGIFQLISSRKNRRYKEING
jgi:hypothetical protein